MKLLPLEQFGRLLISRRIAELTVDKYLYIERVKKGKFQPIFTAYVYIAPLSQPRLSERYVKGGRKIHNIRSTWDSDVRSLHVIL